MINIDNFKNVSAEYRSVPFWSLNDELEKNELIRQIHLMHEQGMGGFFMHPRGGMKDEYMSDQYMKAIRTCVDEAEKLGMKAWLYDEDRFPSGGAGGLVIDGHPEFRQKALVIEEMACSEIGKVDGLLRVYLRDNSSHDKFYDITSVKIDEMEKLPGIALVFSVKYMPEMPMWNNLSYTDLCCKEAVDKFIHETHEKYKQEFGGYFESVIPGIFTDEPNFNVSEGEKLQLPWTLELESEFKMLKGYELAENIIKLYCKIDNYKKIRFDYWDVLSGMFVKAFAENIYHWCQENNMQFTGHFWDHGFPLPTHTGSTMPNYEFMQTPGIDMLFNTIEELGQVGNVMIVKEVSSVANQLGKKRVLSETYGASGWELNFKDQKRIVDWQFALGINLICQHLVHYSLKGFRKRDFPLSFSDHQPWWNCYKLLGDYIGRVSYILSQGKFVGDILVLHPYSSAWTEFGIDEDNKGLDIIHDSFQWLLKTLCGLHYFFDLGDETLMAHHAKVEDESIRVGEMHYKTVLLPHMTTMRNTTFQLLKEFARNGGKIISTGVAPYLMEGEENNELRKFFDSESVLKISQDKNDLEKILKKLGNKNIELYGQFGSESSNIYCHKREYESKYIYFLCNFSKEAEVDVTLKLDEIGQVEEWDALTGLKRNIKTAKEGEKRLLNLKFHPATSHMLIIDSHTKLEVPAPIKNQTLESKITLNEWKVKRLNHNALVLKQCQVKIGDGDWEKSMDVLQADAGVAQNLGMEYRSIFTRQPWMYSREQKSYKAKVQVKYTFTVAEMPLGELYIAAEAPEEFTVWINGKAAARTDKCYIDRAFVMHDIKEMVHLGENKVVLKTDKFNINSSLEWIYVVGDFKICNNTPGYSIESEDAEINAGDWTECGYPYYSGKMQYSAIFEMKRAGKEKYILSLGELWMVAAKVYVNGKEAAILGWEPYQTDITDFVREGENEITIEVMNSLQNLLGHHNGREKEGFATPGSFFYADGDVRFVKSGFDGKAVLETYNCCDGC